MPTMNPKPFDPQFYIVSNLLTLTLIFAAIKLLAPTVWTSQLATSPLTILVTAVGLHFCFAFVEFFFHRYVLHTPVFTLFRHFYQQHTTHHTHTNIEISEGRYHNEYPIMKTKQLEASFFPWYSLTLFALFCTPLFIFLTWLTGWPILLVGYPTILFSITLYEGLHQLFHKPLAWWEPRFLSRFGTFWKRAYNFHLDHHRYPQCNESVSGFFGLPVADWCFGTYFYSGDFYPHQEAVALASPAPRPGRLIQFLDKLFKPA